MSGAASVGKLGAIEKWLPHEEDKSRGGAALLGALRAMQRKGVPMKIERINKAG